MDKPYTEIKTPCFILDTDELDRSIKGFRLALETNFKRSIVGYSVKTNSTPYILKRIAQMDGYAEVVSHDEYELAKICGFPSHRIIYNGPLKSKSTFCEAIINGAFVNIETKRELRWLDDLPDEGSYTVGIRLNINISKVSPVDASGSDDNSRFGFSEETGELEEALTYIKQRKNVTLRGIHIHRTAHSRSVNFYKNTIQYAAKIIKKYNLNLSYIDVGGGFYGIFPNSPTYQEYSDVFYEVLKAHELDDLIVIVEPGNGVVASCFSFVSDVIDVKCVASGLRFATIDGSRNDIDPFYRKASYMAEIIHRDKANAEKLNSDIQIISGCTCLENDRLFEIRNKPLLQEGDRIIFRNVGAYTMCLSPLFIRYFPRLYVKTEQNIYLIREALNAENILI